VLDSQGFDPTIINCDICAPRRLSVKTSMERMAKKALQQIKATS
jgi:hypothetical protein